MTENQSALAKLREKKAKEMKEYKTAHDVERVHHLIAAASLIRDWPAVSAVAASLGKELAAMNLKQAEQDAKEKEQEAKEVAEALAADAKAVENETEKKFEATTSYTAPSVPRR